MSDLTVNDYIARIKALEHFVDVSKPVAREDHKFEDRLYIHCTRIVSFPYFVVGYVDFNNTGCLNFNIASPFVDTVASYNLEFCVFTII